MANQDDPGRWERAAPEITDWAFCGIWMAAAALQKAGEDLFLAVSNALGTS